MLTPANLNALLHGYPVVTHAAILVVEKPSLKGRVTKPDASWGT